MKTILVPTDLSAAAENAALYAAHFAKSIHAKVILFHAYHIPVSTSSTFPLMPMALEELYAENESILHKAAFALHKATGAEVESCVKMGLAGDEILEIKHADLIVMGMKGFSRTAEALLGSIAASTFRKSKIPVLLIPEKATYKKHETIVFACDYHSETGIHTLDVLKNFSKKADPKIYMVNIKRKKESVIVKKQMGTKLEVEPDKVEHIYYFSEKEDLADGINEFAMEHNADIVAVVPHHYSLIEGMFHKSVSTRLAFHTTVPLLALPDNHKSVAAYFL